MLTESPAGTVYDVPDVGSVWVGPNDVRDAAPFGGEARCVLVTNEEDPTTRIWAVVAFLSPEDPEP